MVQKYEIKILHPTEGSISYEDSLDKRVRKIYIGYLLEKRKIGFLGVIKHTVLVINAEDLKYWSEPERVKLTEDEILKVVKHLSAFLLSKNKRFYFSDIKS